MHNDPFHDFDRRFDRAQRNINRTLGVASVIAVLWMLFLAAAISAAIWAGGRFFGVW